MKKIEPVLVVMLLMISTSVCAQYDGDYYNSHPVYQSYESTRYNYDVSNWGEFYAEYAPVKLTTNEKGSDDLSFKGFTIGFSYAFILGSGPVFLETGIEASGSYFKETYYDEWDEKVRHNYDFYYSKVPINVGLRFNVSENFAIVPFGGVHATVNLSAKERYKGEHTGSESYNLFDEDYKYDDGYKRFQLGFQGGLRLILFNTISIRATYKGDLTPLYSDFGVKQKFRGFSFGLGYCF